MSTLKLWLIRHGESYGNVGEATEQPLTSRLTEKGKLQAMAAAEQIIHAPTMIISSPAERTLETCVPIRLRWPETSFSIWPIQEFVYLSPTEYIRLNEIERKLAIDAYWQAKDPSFCDGTDAESFVDFIARVYQFHLELNQLSGFIVTVGHRMFFRAYQLCLMHGFEPSAYLMTEFRQFETTHPIQNGEILRISGI